MSLKMACPVCGDTYLHHQSKSIVKIGADDAQDMSIEHRGNIVSIPFAGENCGHRFTMVFENYKGECFTNLLFHKEEEK